MVTQAPKRSAIMIALAFTLSCIGLIIFVWTQFGGTIPFGPEGYRAHALFSETGLLVPNADVRISGVTIGKVASVEARGVNSLVTVDVAPQYAPLPVDTRAILRQKTLLGEAYVELSPGTGTARKLRDGGTIPTRQVQSTQQLDQVLGSFDKPTQQNLEAVLRGTGEALAGRGQVLNDAIGNLDPAVSELAAVVGVLNQQQANLKALIDSGATVLSTLGHRSGEIRSLVTAGDQVLSATAQRNAQLSATVDALPPFLAQLRTTLGTLNSTLGVAGPSLTALAPVAPLLTPALSELITLSAPALALLDRASPVLDAAAHTLPAIARFGAAFHPALDAILPAAREITPIIDFISLYRTELVTAMANLSADLQARFTASTPAGSASYLRAVASIGRESLFGQTIREPTSRDNTYYAPGGLDYLDNGGGLSASCANTSNPSQAPLPFGNVACRRQPAFPWGGGMAPSYYPHLKRAALPK
ncbi:MAG: MCE family protein [Solirubrobacteraceae bacterium]